MEYSAPLTIEQIVREKRTFRLDEVFSEGWRVFKAYPSRFFLLCFSALIMRDVWDDRYTMNWMFGDAIFWSVLPACIAFLTWDILRKRVGTISSSFPDWTAFKNPLFCGLILMFLHLVLNWLHGIFQEKLSGSEEVILLLLSALGIGFFGVLSLGLLLCGSVGILFMADRGVSVKAGLEASLRAINHQIGKVFLLHLGWMLNTVVIAGVVGGIGSLVATFVFSESLFVISLDKPWELGVWAENVSDETGEIKLNVFILILEYAGMAVGYGIGLCTFAAAYAEVFGLRGHVAGASVEK